MYNKEPIKVDAVIKEQEKCDLAAVIDLSKVDDILLTGTSGKIVEERVKEEILMNRLRQYLDSDAATTDFDIPNDPWK